MHVCVSVVPLLDPESYMEGSGSNLRKNKMNRKEAQQGRKENGDSYSFQPTRAIRLMSFKSCTTPRPKLVDRKNVTSRCASHQGFCLTRLPRSPTC